MELQSVDIINMIRSLVEDGKKSLFGDDVKVNRSEITALLDNLNEVLPNEILKANDYYKESQRILTDAGSEADDVLEDAKQKSESILEEANETANQIISDANSRAEEIVRKAEETRERLIDENEITLLATEKGKQIVSEAEQERQQVYENMRSYMDSKLRNLGEFLAKTYNEVESNRKSL